MYISVKPPGNACPQCKRSGLTNYDKKPENWGKSPIESMDWSKYYAEPVAFNED
jgi:hypothetical protein